MSLQGPQIHTVLVQALNKGQAGLAHKPRLLPVFQQGLSRQQTALGEAAKLNPTAATRVPELNPASQCHLRGAAHSSASCTLPGSSSVPSSHHSTAGRDGAEQKQTPDTAGPGSLMFIFLPKYT